MSGQFKRVTAKSLIKLCEFARISPKLSEPLSPKLQNALKGVWDGSRSQEEALVKLLKAADALVLARSGDNQRRVKMTARKRANK